MQKNNDSSKTILCFGDSGSGKSSFINCFAKNINQPKDDLYEFIEQTNIENPSIIVKFFQQDIGYLDFIDTVGTNNLDCFEDSEIVKAFFSHIPKSYTKIDAVLYFLDSNQLARFHGDIRLSLLQKYY